MLPVLDRHHELVPAQIQIGDDRLEPPISIGIYDIAAIAFGQ
jgi:hypothetical protein